MNKSSRNIYSNLVLVFFCVILLSFFSSCSPSIQYLGDSYPSTNEIDVFYDEKDVQKEYKTIGKMTHGNMFDYEVETIKNKMIKAAKEKGGDAILFIDIKSERGHDEWDDVFDEDRIYITAQVIKYKN